MICTFHVPTCLQYSFKVTLTESFHFLKMLAKLSFLLAVLPQGGCIEDTVTQWPYKDLAYSPRSILGDSIMTHCSAHSELNFMVTNKSICGSSMFLQPPLSLELSPSWRIKFNTRLIFISEERAVVLHVVHIFSCQIKCNTV